MYLRKQHCYKTCNVCVWGGVECILNYLTIQCMSSFGYTAEISV